MATAQIVFSSVGATFSGINAIIRVVQFSLAIRDVPEAARTFVRLVERVEKDVEHALCCRIDCEAALDNSPPEYEEWITDSINDTLRALDELGGMMLREADKHSTLSSSPSPSPSPSPSSSSSSFPSPGSKRAPTPKPGSKGLPWSSQLQSQPGSSGGRSDGGWDDFSRRIWFVLRDHDRLKDQEMSLSYSHATLLSALSAMHMMIFRSGGRTDENAASKPSFAHGRLTRAGSRPKLPSSQRPSSSSADNLLHLLRGVSSEDAVPPYSPLDPLSVGTGEVSVQTGAYLFPSLFPVSTLEYFFFNIRGHVNVLTLMLPALLHS
ncbi:hypothetical protein N3K66_000877 [Trichothecium roseum]|uniref:Uncharacterized protein n=1 Tax=Trichothecium roseum TaxID=47278 RepID=A0ACC0VE09_9HYPO|nr:hypothetical protein N3K66_000877 [Trichothecium roseum]